MKVNKKLLFAINIALIAITVGYFVRNSNEVLHAYVEKKSTSPYTWIQLYNDILVKIKKDYVVDIPTEELIKASLLGMEKTLDPHTNYFEENQYKDMMVHTKGEFGGLGIIISKKDGILTVMSPIDDTPASRLGIQAGDEIIFIEEEATKELSLDEAVDRMRGLKDTEINIKIRREGVPKLIDFKIIRAVIKIKSVPYFSVLEDGYGYVKITNFSEATATELNQAIADIKKKTKLKGIVLDLRNNPGGLLSQAIEVGNVFLPRGKDIVSTKGRTTPERKFKGERLAGISEDVKIVCLINEGSASASEIVSGAIQDWDRGLVAGRRSYGKGSVQTIVPLLNTDEGTKAIKMTTAYYYTPSGRCINRLENSGGYKLFKEGDSTFLKSDIFDTSKVYYTKKLKRVVKAGGGIVPDTTLELRNYDLLEINLEAKSMFFKFAMDYKLKHKELPKDFKFSDELFNKFLTFVKDKEFKYDSYEDVELKKLVISTLMRETLNKVEIADSLTTDNLLDSLKRRKSIYVDDYVDLQKKFKQTKVETFTTIKEHIKNGIMREIYSAYYGQQGKYGYLTSVDTEVKTSVSIMKSGYESILKKAK